MAAARGAGLPAYAIVFDVPASVCKARNQIARAPGASRVIDTQSRAVRAQRAAIDGEGWDEVIVVDDRSVPSSPIPADVATAVDEASDVERSSGLRFGLHISSFDFGGQVAGMGAALGAIARAAEGAGFSSIRLMDHPIQIPQVGRPWHDILEPMVALAHIAAHTDRVTIGPLVAGVTYRHVAHLGKAMATLDVLSGGRAECGLGLAWFEHEHRILGYPFPSVADRYRLLEDALEFLPILWGPGAKPYDGRVLHVAEAICYPRPVRGTIPILVGGQGERRTLRLAARYADACNLFGEPDDVARRVDILHRHCHGLDRPTEAVRVTHLSTTLVGADSSEVGALVDRFGPQRDRERWAARVHAGTVDEQVGRFRALAEVGVDEAIVALEGTLDEAALERFAPVIAAFGS